MSVARTGISVKLLFPSAGEAAGKVVVGLISIGTEIFCSRIPGLTHRQREMCKAFPDAMVAVGDGIRLATNECRYQFRHNRWNCSGIENPTSFGHVVIVEIWS
ncbi:hypothetical protein WA026_013439 [Henosepilachna vigintioctopunctata]|uniref:Protein Wnt n=1 Tax=Henosepilachna vigintioctopunctata TaxID=420089 RepID=A0AAW1VBW8_9CUCU